MFYKKVFLLIILGILSILFGLSLGALEIFGFFDAKSQLNISILLFSIVVTYIIAVCVFLLDFSDRRNLTISFIVCSLLFAISFFITSSHAVLSIILILLYYALLNFIQNRCLFRSKLFIKFSANDIFLPVVKTSFLILMIVLALISFFQTKGLLTSSNLLTPQFVRVVLKPFIPIINKQLTTQINSQLDPILAQNNGQINRKEAIVLVLSESIKNLDEEKTNQYIGVAPQDIPIQNARVSQSGSIDISPVVEALLPSIADTYNERIGGYASFGPFIIAFIVFILLQSFLWPFGIIVGLITPSVFWMLRKTGFIKKSMENVEAERISL